MVNRMKKILIFFIRCYQVIPFSSHKLCRFNPTCSDYMIEAIQVHGIKKGIKLGIKRLCRCHPKGNFGYDPVPKKGENIYEKN